MSDGAQAGPGQSGHDFDAIYRRHQKEVLAYCLRRLSPEDAEDAAAEVFLVLLRRLESVPENSQAWLYGVARKVVSTQRRSRSRSQRLKARLNSLGVELPSSPEVHLVRSAEDLELLDALGRLREFDREILMLTTWEGLTHKEAGAVVGLSESAVSKRVSRARDRLARHLERSEAPRNRSVPQLKEEEG